MDEQQLANHVKQMKSLHTTALDARNGYQEALKDAEGKGLTPLFREMIALHQNNANELEADLAAHGETVSHDGSFMSTVNRAVISIRSLFGGLDESILPGLVDGEQRIIGYYDEALKTCPPGELVALREQRQVLVNKVNEMQSLKADAA